MEGCDTKRAGLLIFVISILVWLITITAVFQIDINDTEGVITENKKLLSGHDASLITVGNNMKTLETAVDNDMKALKKTVRGEMKTLEKAVGDDMKTLKNSFGGLKMSLKGCGSNDATAIWYDPNLANVCDESAPSIACGQNAACKANSEMPLCLDSTGVTYGHGVTPVSGKTDSGVSCQCNANYQCMKDPKTNTPFCGTGASSNDPLGNNVDVGRCGKCQVLAWGGGGESDLTPAHDSGSGLGDETSCGRGMVCCKSGKCATEHHFC